MRWPNLFRRGPEPVTAAAAGQYRLTVRCWPVNTKLPPRDFYFKMNQAAEAIEWALAISRTTYEYLNIQVIDPWSLELARFTPYLAWDRKPIR